MQCGAVGQRKCEFENKKHMRDEPEADSRRQLNRLTKADIRDGREAGRKI